MLPVRTPLAARRTPHPARHVHEHVLHAAATLPPGALQPGDVSAATELRAGLLNADVTPAADAAARCIQHTVDDLGPADLWTLARDTAMTRDDLAWGATATLARERLPQPDLLDELAAQAIVDEIAERTPCRWAVTTPTPFVPRCTAFWPTSPTSSWKCRSPPRPHSTGPPTTT
ncbi:hypothetical protein ACQPXS_08730 [Streptomyces sp. CA-142005]|uniref:hypothetical protein n=1 Tax=Streptomyces sp. CA-142005 TaxID=3240052 RepID=UPI003D8C8EE1